MRTRLVALQCLALVTACGDSGGRDDASGASAPTTVPAETTATTASAPTESTPPTGSDPGTTDILTSSSTGPVDPTATPATTADDTTGPVDPSTTLPDPDTTDPSTTTTLPGTTDEPPPECSTTLKAVVRDFSAAHPDFEDYLGSYKGLVQADLGGDKKPVYAAGGATPVSTGPAEFAQWYNDSPGVNQSFTIDIPLTEVMPGLYTYDNSSYFPIDNQGFGNEGNEHNFHFTSEIHTQFTYQGGEVFTFTGDDDLFLFINNKLAIDLGGVHGAEMGSVDLDASAGSLGIQIGNMYDMDIFHAERHTSESNFRIDTSIMCFVVPG
ncbi:MAG: fibro-slime domain-containing protein [Myxococcales bacterium]|nr:fibro-slime domain-containing protein [Myxococcales bacterium]